MSAFICSDEHISAIVTFACQHNISVNTGGYKQYSGGTEQELADLLMGENITSYNYRYPNDPADPKDFLPVQWDRRTVAPIGVIKLAQSLDYQSCEHPGWKGSRAKAVCDAVIDKAINCLPGYDNAPWSI